MLNFGARLSEGFNGLISVVSGAVFWTVHHCLSNGKMIDQEMWTFFTIMWDFRYQMANEVHLCITFLAQSWNKIKHQL